MDKIKKMAKQLWQDESGQGATEYILILVVIVALVFAFKKQIVAAIDEQTKKVGGEIGGAIGNLVK